MASPGAAEVGSGGVRVHVEHAQACRSPGCDGVARRSYSLGPPLIALPRFFLYQTSDLVRPSAMFTRGR